jgi:hypothetical protein
MFRDQRKKYFFLKNVFALMKRDCEFFERNDEFFRMKI